MSPFPRELPLNKERQTKRRSIPSTSYSRRHQSRAGKTCLRPQVGSEIPSEMEKVHEFPDVAIASS